MLVLPGKPSICLEQMPLGHTVPIGNVGSHCGHGNFGFAHKARIER